MSQANPISDAENRVRHSLQSTYAAAQAEAVSMKTDGASVQTNLTERIDLHSQTSDLKNSTPPVWNASEVYVNGDRVLYANGIYQAKWWTLGETPGQTDVWELKTEPLTLPALPPLQTVPAVKTDNQAITAASTRIIGYYPSWKPNQTDCIRYDVLTHIIYAFAIPTSEGDLLPLENPDTAKQIVQEAHGHNKKVLLAVGGWSYQDTPLEATFMSATATPAKREAFAAAILALCQEYGFDGVDIDWEHPRVDGASSQQYEAFLLLLADKLHAENKLLTIAVLSGATADGNIYYDAAAHTNAVLNAVDWLHVMAYDGGDGARHSPYQLAVDSLQYWHVTRGVPSEKIVLGVPFYARPSWASYEDILKAAAEAPQNDHVTYQGMDVWYNGINTIQQKTRLVKENNYGGIMIWEITQDTTDQKNSLQTVIARTLQQTAA